MAFLGESTRRILRSLLMGVPFQARALCQSLAHHQGQEGGGAAYIRERLTNGIVEGTNNRLRMIARRAFGFHSPEALIAMLYLCCGGTEAVNDNETPRVKKLESHRGR